MPDQPTKYRRASAAVCASVLALSLSLASCGDASEVTTKQEVQTASASPQDGDWIRIDGVITSALPGQFVLDYGSGTVTVELDDWDEALEGLSLLPGDKVSVTGRVDKNLFGARSIEAGAVYLDNLNTVYFANAADEEEFGLAAIPQRTFNPGIDYTGWVTATTDDGFDLGSGPLKIHVDTSKVQTPLAKAGVHAGDRVYVWGDLSLQKDGGTALVAEGLMRLVDSQAETSQRAAGASARATATPSEAASAAGAEEG